MNRRGICTGHFTLPLAVEDAVPLFTPEGERRWAGSSWDPSYAIPEAVEDDSAPGTVFTTKSDGGTATWIVLECRHDGMRYARVAHERIAGTIEVTCVPGRSASETEVTVTYDVTSLSPGGTAFVKELRGHFRRVPRRLAQGNHRWLGGEWSYKRSSHTRSKQLTGATSRLPREPEFGRAYSVGIPFKSWETAISSSRGGETLTNNEVLHAR